MADVDDVPGPESEAELQRLVRVDEIVTAAMAEARAGKRVDLNAIVSAHSDLAEELRLALRGVASLERAAAQAERDIAEYRMPPQIGPYEVVRELGRGGMGLVYEARDESLDRRVAIKVLTAQVSDNKAFVERFKREAHAAARLEHPNVVPVYGVGEENGRHYFVMKYVDGHGLDALTSIYSKSRGRVNSGSSNDDPRRGGSVGGDSATESESRRKIASDLAQGRLEQFEMESGNPGGVDGSLPSLGRAYHRNVARIGLSVASALGYAHARGVLHRDVKPGNVLLDGRGHVWVADFGLAKVDESDDLTREGDFVGTLRYMAPEQFQGHAEPRSDLYGLGLVLYEMLTLGPALQCDSRAELVHELLYTVPKRPDAVRPEVPRDLARIVMKAIEKLPEERYRSADQMAADLRAFLEDRPIAARAPSALYLTRLAIHRNRPLFLTIGVLVLSLFLGAAAYMQQLWSSAQAEAVLAYRGQLAAAASSLQNADVPMVQLRLANCPDELRGWEWSHLSASADQSLSIVARTQYPIETLQHVGNKLMIGSRGAAVLIDGESREEVVLPGMKAENKEIAGVWKISNGWVSYHFRTGLWWTPEGGYPAGDLPGPDDAAKFGLKNLRGGRAATAVAVSESAGIAVVVERSGAITIVDLERFVVLRSRPTGQSSVDALAISADGAKVWVGATDGNVVVWNTRDLTSKRIFSKAGTSSVIALSPDERTVAVGSSDHSIYLLNLDGEIRARLIGHKGAVSGLAFSPDGKVIASISDDMSLRLWDERTGEQLQVLTGNPRSCRELHFSPDGRRLYSGNTAGTVQEWRVGLGGGRAELHGHVADVTALGFTDRGDRFATGGRDATIRVHDAASLRLDNLILGHPSELMGLLWHGSDEQILSTDRSGHLMNWDAESGELLWRERLRELATEPVRLPESTPGTEAHGALACIGSHSGELCVLRLSDGAIIAKSELPDEGVSAVGVSADGQTIYAGTIEGNLILMDPETLDVRARVEGLHSEQINAIVYIKEFDRLATVSLDGSLAFLNAKTLKRDGMTQSGGLGHSGYTDGLEDIAVSPDGRLLAVASHSRLVRLIDAATGTITLDLLGHQSWVRRLAFAPDGKTLVSTGSMSSVRIWDDVSTATRKQLIDERLDLEMAAGALLESWIGHPIRDLDDVEVAFEALRTRPASHEALERAVRSVLHQYRSDHIVTVLERDILAEDHGLAEVVARQYVGSWRRRHPMSYEVTRLALVADLRTGATGESARWLADLERLDMVRIASDPVVAAFRVVFARGLGDPGRERVARSELTRLLAVNSHPLEREAAVDRNTALRILAILAPE